MRSRRNRRNKNNKPWWYKRLDHGQQCDCDVDEFPVTKSEQKVGYSDSLVKYMKLKCPQCSDTFGSTKLLVEG